MLIFIDIFWYQSPTGPSPQWLLSHPQHTTYLLKAFALKLVSDFDLAMSFVSALWPWGKLFRNFRCPQIPDQASMTALNPRVSSWACVQDMLEDVASSFPERGLTFYTPGYPSRSTRMEYHTLRTKAKDHAEILQSLPCFQQRRAVLIHLDDHLDNVLWFWAVLFANAVPVLSSQFSNVHQHRQRHIESLSSLLESPLCITKNKFLPQFAGSDHTLRIHTIESLTDRLDQQSPEHEICCWNQEDNNEDSFQGIAMVMLTSGSTGNAKAVPLAHRNVLAAIAGKASMRGLPPDKPLLNWIGLDHVAGLTEIHLLAMSLGVDQIHVAAIDIVSGPMLFLDLLSQHKVSRSFAPNFFFTKLVAQLADQPIPNNTSHGWDFSHLVWLGSGGEPNDTETCLRLSELLAKYGARQDVIVPGFGMTETCAGCIYSMDCPALDIAQGRTFVKVGTPMQGVQLRITTLEKGELVTVTKPNVVGNLELRGNVVFGGYYRNAVATANAFTPDGWFATGDRATFDSRGNLSLIGRGADVFNINGVKYRASEVQAFLDQALRSRVSRVICFPSRTAGTGTDQVTVACVLNAPNVSTEEEVSIHQTALEACMACTGSRCDIFIVPDESLLPCSTLGKISASKMQCQYSDGVFDHFIERHRRVIEMHRRHNYKMPQSDTESILLKDFSDILGVDTGKLGVESPAYELGFTSMDLIRLRRKVQSRFGVQVPLGVFLKSPTVRKLAGALETYHLNYRDVGLYPEKSYDPVVVLRLQGSKTPLWLFHPGVGEVLVFVSLAQHFADDDRPVFALRARGFDAGQSPFGTLTEAVKEYYAAIKKRQPQGPYALAGYSYGAMLAFEVAKLLDVDSSNIPCTKDQSVRFLGSFNLPPHIKLRMRQLNWNACLLNLAYFLGLTSESHANEVAAADNGSFAILSRQDAWTKVLGFADKNRMAELGLEAASLNNWASLAYGLQSLAIDYEPRGQVGALDVFSAVPLQAVASSRDEWEREHLGSWKEFCRTPVRFHRVEGAHYTMLGPEHVASFAETFKAALIARGV